MDVRREHGRRGKDMEKEREREEREGRRSTYFSPVSCGGQTEELVMWYILD